MTSPLVKPAAGYISLSRVDSSKSRPSIETGNRSPAILVLLDTFCGTLVVPQAQEPGEAQPPVRGPVAVTHLDDQFRTYPVGPPGILARHGPGHERRVALDQRLERGQQLLLGLGPDSAAHPPPAGQTLRGRARHHVG